MPNAVVVGGGSGIGAAIAGAYRSREVNPLVWDIAGTRDIDCDITDEVSVRDALDETIDRVGMPDQVTITAGVGRSGVLLDEPVEAWDSVMAVNARGPWLVMRALARAMIDAGMPGSIVATSSVSARLVDRGMGLYCASKAALSMIVKVAACEWAPHGIRVNAVGPGVTETPMLGRAPTDRGWLQSVKGRTPLGRLGQPGDIAEVALALHDLAWVTGQVVECDGGLGLHSPIDAFGEAQRAREGG
ncbi:MAG: SDR family NAD(P)-dependent oxidoreductase [Actinomycetota bacterium]|nr:SDR family NAD(P)-dependent oxidoreductase [Actinomycetota bacterium]